ncbi:MAG: pilus assembly PilX N-terminal domain-containing protein [Candidatus Aminicenantia bacterium]
MTYRVKRNKLNISLSILDHFFLRFKDKSGSALIIALLMVAFLSSVGVLLLLVTGTGPKVAGNVALQGRAFNAAEAGFDAAWAQVEGNFEQDTWVDFDNHYLTEPTGIDLPSDDNYFRKLTDLEILNLIDPDGDGNPDVANVIFFRQAYIPDSDSPDGMNHDYTYTVFLIDDEAGSGTADPLDALLVCIGTSPLNTTKRLEIEVFIEVD